MDASNLPMVPATGMALHHMLSDLQGKCETYKSNYNVLKIEHSSLQDELLHIQGEVKRLHGQQDKLQLQLAERSRELLNQQREMEELRLQVMTPKRLELLRTQVQQELEAPVRQRFNKLEEETEKYRSEFNKLRYAFTVLNSQFEHQKEEHVGGLEGQKMRYEVEIAHLKKEKENLAAQFKNVDPLYERKQVEFLLKEKTQLTMLLKGLQAEVDELQAKKDNSDQQVESIQLSQNRQLTESQAMVKSLESERQCMAMRLERMESELHLSLEQNNQLTRQLHKIKREVNSLTCQIESLKLSHKTELDNAKLEFNRSKGEVERECDSLRAQKESKLTFLLAFHAHRRTFISDTSGQCCLNCVSSGLQIEVVDLKEMLERHNELLVSKEMEMIRKVKSVCDEEMYKTTALLEEKLELEQRALEFEQQKTMQEMNMQTQKDEWEDHLQMAHKREESVRKELQSLRAKLKQQSAPLEELERHKAEKNQELYSHLGALSWSEAELMEANDRLREKVDIMREENIRRGADRLVEDRKEREAKLEDKYTQLKDKLQRAASAEKKRRDLEEKKEQSLHSTIQMLREQIDELKQDGTSANKRLMDYQQRHNEFRRLLMCSNGSFSVGTAQISSPTRPALFLGSEMMLSNVQQEEEEQREMARLRQRVDDLEKLQHQQMEELGCIEQKEDKASL
ncbi:centrosomal protein of 83 kDa-like isoform X3 [Syngnathus acus]|uniref:centrosomal protein of 83 kDa-like isoform X3 n=1 Tax=Syngnathus acus TaxID=161584 RepID=UPI0018860498|nr:centrosomal protein of 83 kDa-like isoform X3 [Syngnathus acus]